MKVNLNLPGQLAIIFALFYPAVIANPISSLIIYCLLFLALRPLTSVKTYGVTNPNEEN